MKSIRNLFFLLLFTISCVAIGAIPMSESWVSLGYEYGTFNEKAELGSYYYKSKMKSPGINFTAYRFKNDSPVGLFVSDSFLFPSENTVSTPSGSATFDYSDVTCMQIGIVIGPSYRNAISQDLSFRMGGGLSLFQLTVSDFYDSLTAYNIGLGGDIGAKFDFSEKFFLDFGCKLGYDFYRFESLNGEGSSSTDFDSYRTIRVQPYISVGMNFIKG